MDGISSGCYVIDKDFNVVSTNETARSIYPQIKVGEKCYKCLMNLDGPCGPCPVANGQKGPNTYVDPIRNISETVDAVELEVEGHGKCHALVFSTVGLRESLAATLPLSSEELVELGLIKALTADYYDVFSINVNDGKTRMFRKNNQLVSAESENKTGLLYCEKIKDYAEKYVLSEDKEVFLKENDLENIKELIKTNEYIRSRYRVRLNGEVHYFVRNISRVGNADNFDTVVVGVASEDERIFNIQRRKELEEDISRIEYDYVTGLYTGKAFVVRSEELLKKNPDVFYDFCICRVENQELISHQYGKEMLVKTYALIGKLLSERDNEYFCIGYLGDGIYASFTPNDPKDIRKATVMAFKEEIIKRSEIKDVSLRWSIYTNVSKDFSVMEIIDKSIYALQIVRQNVKGDYIEFDQSVLDQMELEAKIEGNFENALATGEFVPWYQPKYSIETGKIVGAEALVRWAKPNGEMVSPAGFIPVLEKIGKINLLDENVFRQVCDLKARNKGTAIEKMPISVNLSRASMFKGDIASIYGAIADKYGVDRKTLPIEITESAAVRAASMLEFSNSLIENGFEIHMDDFGSGYSSLAVLQMLPFSCIKLDKSLIDNIGIDASEKLLKHTIAFAKECGKSVVAEGVERSEQVDFLRSVDCDMVQGYYYSKPVNEETFLKMCLGE